MSSGYTPLSKYGNGKCTEERTKELDNQKNHCTNEADNLTQNWWGAAQFPSSLLLCSKICCIDGTFNIPIAFDNTHQDSSSLVITWSFCDISADICECFADCKSWLISKSKEEYVSISSLESSWHGACTNASTFISGTQLILT